MGQRSSGTPAGGSAGQAQGATLKEGMRASRLTIVQLVNACVAGAPQRKQSRQACFLGSAARGVMSGAALALQSISLKSGEMLQMVFHHTQTGVTLQGGAVPNARFPTSWRSASWPFGSGLAPSRRLSSLHCSPEVLS